MDISVVIINFNTFDLTCNCIESLIAKTQGCEYEIILVDNASKECDPILFKNKFPGIKLIANDDNTGFAHGCNQGIQAATGEYVLLLNSDTTLINNALKICLDFLKANSSVGVVACQAIFSNGKIQPSCHQHPSIRLLLLELLRLHKFLNKRTVGRLLLNGFFDHEERVTCDWVWGTFFMFPKKIISQLPEKKLDESFFMYVEDIQWCLDIRGLGYQIYFLPEAKINHVHQQSSKQTTSSEKKSGMDFHENYDFFLRKNYSWLKQKTIKALQWLLKHSQRR